ncbi:MAG TPA: glycerophosphodiester phosphodiesterase [Anaerolineales bacterium]|nr:glycerophosphodiester phosphodiesterase [Anaerolineales bacterium]
MKLLKIGETILLILFPIAVVFVFLFVISKEAGDSEFYSNFGTGVLVIAHQGGDGLWPGNTLYAFQQAVNMGVDVIETDIRQTKDGIIVISHDDNVDGKSNGSGLISDLTYAELQQLDAGYTWTNDGGLTFPYRGQGITYSSLEDIFIALPSMRFNIDMKQIDPPIYHNFCNLLQEYDMENKVIAASFTHANMTEFRKICPRVTTAGDESETRVFVFMNFAYLGRLYSPNFKVFQVPTESSGIVILTPNFIQAAHQRNLRVDAWTIDNPDEMRRLIDMGVDGIISDRPDVLMQVLGR